MLYAAFSLDCFHCVNVRTVGGTAELRSFLRETRGTRCPLCGVRCTTWQAIIDKQEYENRLAGTDIWTGEGDEVASARSSAAVPPGTSAAAEALRGQVGKAAAERLRQLCRSVTDVVQASTTFDLGRRAWQEGRHDDARRALTVCAGTHSHEAPSAAVILGQLAESPQESARWYEKATTATDAETRAAAYYLLAMARQRAADREAACRALQECVDVGRSRYSDEASRMLGDLRIELGDLAGAIEAYRPALDADDPEVAAGVACNLAWVHETTGDWDEAVRLWERAFAVDGSEARLVAAFNLGRAWDMRGKRRKARHYYRIALDAQEPGVADRAREALNS